VLTAWVDRAIPGVEIVPRAVKTDTGGARARQSVRQIAKVDVVIGSVVSVTVVVPPIGDKRVMKRVHGTVAEVSVIRAMGCVTMVVHRGGTAINVKISVMTSVLVKFVDRAMEYVRTDAKILTMEIDVSTSVVLPAVPDNVTDITVPVPDVVTDILVCHV
jgi:hypothetical protein